MSTVSIRARRLAFGVVGLAIAIAPAVAVLAGSGTPAPRLLACQDTEVEDSFSMNCAPAIYPDTSDPLTEAEVAMPGFNAYPGRGGAGIGHAGR